MDAENSQSSRKLMDKWLKNPKELISTEEEAGSSSPSASSSLKTSTSTITIDIDDAEEILSEITNDNNTPSSAKKPKMLKRGKYAAISWLTNPKYKDWLEKENSDYSKMRCKLCQSSLTPQLSTFELHMKSKKHKALEESLKFVAPMPLKNTGITTATVINEIRSALYVACHTSINSVNHLIKVQKQSCSSKTVQDMTLNRTKLTAVLKNAIAPHIVECVKRDIGNSTFSLIIDESTDISVKKYLGTVIKYYSTSRSRIVTLFLTLVPLVDCTASGIVQAIKEVLAEFGLSLHKLRGIGTDNASVMVGVKNGVYQKLKTEIPNLVLIPCVCHSLQLAVSKAAKKTLPDEIEFLISETYNWFSSSASRQESYGQLYSLLNNGHNPKKIVRACETRWMSIDSSIQRVSDQWLELKTHFEHARTKERCHKAAILSDLYSDAANLAYVQFLRSILHQVSRVNSLFESNTADITKIVDDLIFLIKYIVNILIPIDVPNFDPLSSPLNKEIWNKCPYLGYETEKILRGGQISDEKQQKIRESCENFLLERAMQLRQRLPSNINILKNINCFNVKNVFQDKANSKVKITALLQDLSCDESEHPLMKTIQNQLNNLYLIEWRNTDNSLLFWDEVYKYEDAANGRPFEKLAMFAISFLVLPFSNAEVERIFSVMNIIKTKIRNRIGLRLLIAVMRVKTWLKSMNKCCHDFEFEVKDPKLQIIGKKTCYDDDDTNANDDEEEEILDEITSFL